MTLHYNLSALGWLAPLENALRVVEWRAFSNERRGQCDSTTLGYGTVVHYSTVVHVHDQ